MLFLFFVFCFFGRSLQLVSHRWTLLTVFFSNGPEWQVTAEIQTFASPMNCFYILRSRTSSFGHSNASNLFHMQFAWLQHTWPITHHTSSFSASVLSNPKSKSSTNKTFRVMFFLKGDILLMVGTGTPVRVLCSRCISRLNLQWAQRMDEDI